MLPVPWIAGGRRIGGGEFSGNRLAQYDGPSFLQPGNAGRVVLGNEVGVYARAGGGLHALGVEDILQAHWDAGHYAEGGFLFPLPGVAHYGLPVDGDPGLQVRIVGVYPVQKGPNVVGRGQMSAAHLFGRIADAESIGFGHDVLRSWGITRVSGLGNGSGLLVEAGFGLGFGQAVGNVHDVTGRLFQQVPVFGNVAFPPPRLGLLGKGFQGLLENDVGSLVSHVNPAFVGNLGYAVSSSLP